MLTKKAMTDRKWMHCPELAKLLEEKQLSIRWTGATSVSDSMFDEINRILTIFALVQDSEQVIGEAIAEQGDLIRSELMHLSSALNWAAEKFLEASKLTSQLAHKT